MSGYSGTIRAQSASSGIGSMIGGTIILQDNAISTNLTITYSDIKIDNSVKLSAASGEFINCKIKGN
jgi:hypothetical protein